MERERVYENEVNLKATELRLGLPGRDQEEESNPVVRKKNKRGSDELAKDSNSSTNSSSVSVFDNGDQQDSSPPPSKAQVVGWPPIRSYRKNCLEAKKKEMESGGMLVKVSMDGAPYLRKTDLKVYKSYAELLMALEFMFNFKINGEYCEREGFNGSDYAPTYEDKDGDWMLVGDVPWEMFMSTCKRLRIMKGSEARGLGCS